MTGWLASAVDGFAAKDPDGIALRDAHRNLTWRRLHTQTRALTGLLRSRTSPGDRVLVLSAPRGEVLIAYAACARAGVIAVPIDPTLTDAEIGAVLDGTRPVLALADVRGAARLAPLPTVDITRLDTLPTDDTTFTPPGADHGFLILHTSGTSGRAKAVLLGEEAYRAHTDAWVDAIGAGPRTVYLHTGGLHHAAVAIPLTHLASGSVVCLMDRFTPQGCLEAVAAWRVTQLFAVPSALRLMLATRARHVPEDSTLRTIVHGGARMDADLASAVAERFRVPLHDVYGSTEGAGAILIDGRPAPGIGIRVVDGELWLRSAAPMRGYWPDPVPPDEGWWRTGDLAHADDEGRIRVTGRRDELIIRGGKNVHPAEIEAVLRSSPLVSDVAVVAAPSAEWGQVPVAFTVAHGADVEGTLLALCRRLLAPHKRPATIACVPELPRGRTGKPHLAVLRAWAERLAAQGKIR